jgi:uncharacterized membrane protein YhiD involved in acid resistance
MRALAAAVLIALLGATEVLVAQSPADLGVAQPPAADSSDTMDEVRRAVFRLPLAALLGAALAVRPKRRGTPPRQPAVIQTQIILAIVGAVVMLVVGSNLARAFGVVGAAGLVRYRAKVEDNKDAGVMLSTLAVGLASGVGQYAMAVFSAGFILIALWIIESFEPEGRKLFEVKVKLGDDTDDRRKELDALLARFHVEFDLLSSSDEELVYEVWVPLEMQKERISNAILKLDPEGHASVEWAEKKIKNK